jgi:hypothetical protein
MAQIPVPRSFEQILGDIIDAYRSKIGVRNLRVGGPLLSAFEATARSQTRGSQDIFGLLNAIALDRATGLALDRAGQDEGVPRIQEGPATGKVTISDSSFTKKTSKLFQGSPAPIAGSVSLDLADASLFPSSGQVYIGRGTPNYEGPLSYTSKTNNGTHWTLALSTGTTRFHNTSEDVILAQGGNRVAGASTIVRTPQANVSDAVDFRTLYSSTLPDGETSISNVQVVAQKPGTIGNVSAGAIKEFASQPFAGATVTNPIPYSNGVATEKDDDYRERIKNVIASRQAGTSLAITTAVTGITSTDENKRVSSASLVRRLGSPSTLYIDDGTGYEERTAGVAIEALVDSAQGGEDCFDAGQRPVARAFVMTSNSSPYALTPSGTLTVRVGGVTSTHNFDESAFTSIGNASAYEVAASINSNPRLGFLARTAESGTKVSIFGKTDENEDIEVVSAASGVDANDALAFPLGVNYTLQLFKNDRVLTKDGREAAVVGLAFSQWNALSGNQTLTIAVDNTPSTTHVFADQDFIDAQTGFSTLARNSLAAWVKVFNARLPGITATADANSIVLTSNAGRVPKAAVSILGGTLVTNHMFPVATVLGANRDYTLDRNTSQVVLAEPLAAGDKLTIGSVNSRAFVESDEISPTTIADPAKLWFVVDGDAEIVKTGVNAATEVSISVNKLHEWGVELALSAVTGTPFANVQAGDWVILWDPALPASIWGSYRVVDATSASILIECRQSVAARLGHRSVALQTSGSDICKVLTTGGSLTPVTNTSTILGIYGTDACEIFDPNESVSAPATPMANPRAFHTATLLPSGKVVVTGGLDDAGEPLNTIETYDPGLGTWTTSGVHLNTAVFHHRATLLADGKILITGGDNTGGAINVYQVYDPIADTITAAQTMVAARAKHQALLMPSGNVLVIGGYNASYTDLNSTEIWDSGTGLTTVAASMTQPRSGFGASLVGTSPTTALVAGNHRGAGGGTDTYEIYTIAGNTWGTETSLPGSMAFEDNDLTKLTNGHVVGLYGYNTGTPSQSRGFKYDGGTFTAITVANAAQTDVSTKWLTQTVELKDGAAGVKNIVGVFGGAVELSPVWSLQPSAAIEKYDEVAGTWTTPSAPITTSLVLTNAGLVVVRTEGLVREITIQNGANYTASTIAAVINADKNSPASSGLSFGEALIGATAAVYQTKKIRVYTNTFSAGGSIALVAQNEQTSGFGLDTGDSVSNLTSYLGSVQSNSELGTPEFRAVRVLGVSTGGETVERPLLDVVGVSLGDSVVGLRNWWRGANGLSTHDGSSYFYPRAGSNFGFRTRIKSSREYSTVTRADVRSSGIEPWSPLDRTYLAAPFAISARDDLTVQVDGDVAKRYALKMYRALTPVGGTYALQNTFKDADGGGVSLAATFGLKFDFNDFAVHMPARSVLYGSDSTRSMLLRYYRLGPDGEGTIVSIGNPTGPNQDLSVECERGDAATTVTIRLKSGAARTLPNIHINQPIKRGQVSVTAGGVGTWIYVANMVIGTASRTSNVTTATPTLPVGVTDHGIRTGDKVWVQSTDVNFSSGLKTIASYTSTTFTYAETAANQGSTSNIGTVSYDNTAEASFSGGSVAVGDFLQPGSGEPCYRITAVDGSGRWVKIALAPDSASFSIGELLSQTTSISIFQGSSQTATQVAAAVNALAAQTNSKCPISVKILGSGNGIIDRQLSEQLDDAVTVFTLADGLNWVSSTSAPGSVAGDYQLTFKKAVTGSLSTGADWTNETIRLVPISAQNIVDWLKAPTVSGLFTMCEIKASDNGCRVQITSKTPGSTGGVQIQGGLANAAVAAIVGSQISDGTKSFSLVKKSDADGIVAGAWAHIQNEEALPKSGALTGLELQNWSADGFMQFSSSVVVPDAGPTQSKVRFERQGRYIAISDMGIGGDASLPTTLGGWLRISLSGSPTVDMPQVSTANLGIYRILRVDKTGGGSSGTMWIENTNAIEEAAECTLTVYPPNAPMPGDKIVIASPAWGSENQGVWSISAIGETSAGFGDGFTYDDRLTVDVSSRTPVPQSLKPALGTDDGRLIYPVEGEPAVHVMKVEAVYPNQDDGAYVEIRWDTTIDYSAIGASAGSVMTMSDKLGFPTEFAGGGDGYRYSTGLIGEANRVIYGVPGDTATYPGVAAEGARINLSGPLVKRIRLALLLRVSSSVATNSDVADRVRSAVATVVNQTVQGAPISLSSIIGAAEKVVGVGAVTILSPAYNATSDRIPVQPYEKPLVLDLDQDIQVSFSGE